MKILILEGLHGNNKGKKMQRRLKQTDLKVGDRVVLDCHDWKVIKVVEQEKRPELKGYADVSIGVPGRLTISYTPILKQKKDKESELIKSIRNNYKKNMEKWQLQELRNRPYFKTIVTEVKGKPSRGENLEKIKFPCWCSFIFPKGYKRWGMINRIGGLEDQYHLTEVNRQGEYSGCLLGTQNSLNNLIEYFNIEILKGELHLWREVKS